MRLIILLIIVLLSACQSSTPLPTPTPAALTGQQVIGRFIAAGLAIGDVKPSKKPEGTPLPNTYEENLDFVIAEVAPRGGQIFICKTKEYCDVLMVYFDALKGLGGPYFYQSPDGRVVTQLNSGLTTATAEKFAAVIRGLP